MITVLIRCSDDYRVLECISSIKETSPSSPVVVSMTPNKKLERAVVEMGVKCCVVPRHNAAVTNNKGIELVKTKKVIITDADTTFEKYAIRLLEEALDIYDVVKPRLIFRSGRKLSYFSPVANLRTFFNDNQKKMYIPGISFKLSIKSKIGGYLFDEKIPWGEDSDFSDRVDKHKLKTKTVKRAVLFHPSVGVRHDLADAALIGSKKQNEWLSWKIIYKRFKFYHKLLNEYGIPTLLYGVLWYTSFDVGRLFQKHKLLKNTLELLSWRVLSRKRS